ncbi:extradiol dioxygenase [Nocardia panacis]|uniref:Extradiol dioxygenase n=1 Tax=Nocardia panacis TaxID=2340916 RepID=A0A3A4KE46_9NOCA|nr:VOC family protein [Nocardia panacis]RJO73765.1 extradiol dioxygenase [Nocardia panacis]
MITGLHTILYSTDPDADRRFFRDVLGFPATDVGAGWLIFQMPPADLGVHPIESGSAHELHLICDDLAATMAELAARGVDFTRDPTMQSWGVSTAIRLPGGGELGLYEPRYPPLGVTRL